jgi:CheY-like chemotaxis protein
MKQTVLIIDDDENDVLIAKRVLSKIDREIKTAVALNGAAGLEFLRSGIELPALILLDLKMPGMSGFDTLRQIRADDLLKSALVIVVTSSYLESDMTEAYASGADCFLYKTLDTDQFTRDLKLIVERRIRN